MTTLAVVRRGRDFPVLQHAIVAVDTFQPDAKAPQPGHVLDHFFGAVVERPVVVTHVSQGQRAVAVIPADLKA